MIVRIMGEGQFEVADSVHDELNRWDAQVEAAVQARDEVAFRSALDGLLGVVRRGGTTVADDVIVDSALILPHADASIDEVVEMLGEEGLIPD
ncbi:MAG: PspA-associated protein PspAA [Nocardioidaceae bacterium]